MTNYTFDQLLDFTRTTAGTFVGSDGLIQLTPASVNLLTWTQQFDNAVWAKSGVTVTANTTAAPDGTSTADTLTASAGASTHRFIGPAVTIAVGNSCTHSIYVKAGSYNFVQIHDGASAIYFANFDLTTGAVGTSANCTATITDVGNGWYRCAMIFMVAAANPVIGVCLVSSASAVRNESWTAAGTETVFIWGAQTEVVPDANLVLGSELITNPGPFSATTGWTAAVGSISTSSGSLVITVGGGGSARAVSSAMSGLTIGAAYRINVSGVAGDASAKSIRITTNADGSTGALFTQAISGTSITYYFVATATTHYLALPAGSVLNQTFSLSQASVKQITSTVGMPSTYTRNNGGVYPPRFDYDPVTLQPKGILIEEQRVNLLTYSELFTNVSWSLTSGTLTSGISDPAGGTNAFTLTATAGNASIQQAQLGTSGSTYTTSFWIKRRTGTGQVSLRCGDITNIPITVTSSWARYSVTGVPSTTTVRAAVVVSVSGDEVDIWGAQLELAAFPTSYIPTVASQVTRAADQCSIVAPNFAPWYNQSEGTVVSEFSSFSPTSTSTAAWTISDETNSNRWFAFAVSSTIRSFMATGGVTQASIDVGTYAANTVFKSAFAISANSVQAAVNGTLGTEDTTATVPTVVRLTVGSSPIATTNFLNGHIRSIRYYPVRLSNAQLQALTA